MPQPSTISEKLQIERIAFFFCCLVIAGMLTTNFARSLSSIGTIGLAVTAIFYLWRNRTWSSLFNYKPLLIFAGIFLVHLSGFLLNQPENYKQFQRDLVLKLPLLILPLAFSALPPISKKQLNGLYYFFVISVFAGSLYSTAYYLSNFDYVNELYIHSEVMETPTNHVRYSLMVGFAVIIGYRFIKTGYFVFRPWEKWLLVFITAWLFIFMHMLAVRSGLVAFYVVVALGLAYDFFVGRKFLKSFLIGIGLMLSLVIAFYTLPTFYNKFYLTIADVKSTSDPESAHDYSIAGRVYSYKVAIEVFKEQPVLGTGVGDLPVEMAKKYESMFPEILDRGHLLPHNQFIYSLTAFGIIGLVLILICFYYPAFRFLPRFEPLFFIHYLIISFSFIFETTLETQVGLTYSIIFILLPLWYFRKNEKPESTWQNAIFFC